MNYEKAEGNREVSEPRFTHASFLPGQGAYDSDVPMPDEAYSKGDPTVEPRLFFVFVEGERKEMDYLSHLQGRRSYSNLKVVPFPMSNSPLHKGNVVGKITEALAAVKSTGRLELGSLSLGVADIDSLSVVVDVDELYNQINESRKQGDNAKWIISNPCFEIWLYYAFHDSPYTDFNLHLVEVAKRSGELKHQLDKVHPGGIGCRDAFNNMAAACINSAKNYKEDSEGMPMLYSTGMHILANEIFSTIEREYNERQRSMQERIHRFRRNG